MLRRYGWGYLAILTLLGGCAVYGPLSSSPGSGSPGSGNPDSSSADFGDVGPYPTAYQGIVKAYLVEHVYAPYSWRYPRLSPPSRGRLGDQTGWVVCFSGKALQPQGGFQPFPETSGFLIRHDKIVATTTETELCATRVTARWKEMEGN